MPKLPMSCSDGGNLSFLQVSLLLVKTSNLFIPSFFCEFVTFFILDLLVTMATSDLPWLVVFSEFENIARAVMDFEISQIGHLAQALVPSSRNSKRNFINLVLD